MLHHYFLSEECEGCGQDEAKSQLRDLVLPHPTAMSPPEDLVADHPNLLKGKMPNLGKILHGIDASNSKTNASILSSERADDWIT